MFQFLLPRANCSIIKLTLLSTTIFLGLDWSVRERAIAQKTSPQSPPGASSDENAQLNQMAQKVHQQVNQYRQSLGLAPLKLNPLISEQAKAHSSNMADQEVAFSHQGFEQRINALKGQIAYRRAAENVAYNQGYQDPVTNAVQGWIDSESHRRNMKGNYNLTGIGVAVNQAGEYYFTQIFVLEN